jgi:hypothetical protein
MIFWGSSGISFAGATTAIRRVVSEIPLNSRGKVDRDALHKEIKESRPLKSTQDIGMAVLCPFDDLLGVKWHIVCWGNNCYQTV